MCLWGYYYWMVFRRLSFGFPPVMYQVPLFMLFGRYFMGFCLIFLPVMCLWGYYYWMVFRRLSFGIPPVMYQGPLCMSFGRNFVGFCLVFLPVMYLGAVYLLFGWYSVGCFVSFTCLLSFGYHHMDFFTLPVYRTSSVSIISYCYPMVRESLPVACEAHLVEIRVWRSRSS